MLRSSVDDGASNGMKQTPTRTSATRKKIVFVCVANICRSPIAEACFKQFLVENGLQDEWSVDSAGIADFMIGSPPDPRGKATMTKHKIYHHVANHRARQLTISDYDKFDHIMALDETVLRELEKRAPLRTFKAKLHLLGSYDNQKMNNGSIADPFTSIDPEDFDRVFEQCYRSCKNFLEQL